VSQGERLMARVRAHPRSMGPKIDSLLSPAQPLLLPPSPSSNGGLLYHHSETKSRDNDIELLDYRGDRNARFLYICYCSLPPAEWVTHFQLWSC
jgi:hypothetical protein